MNQNLDKQISDIRARLDGTYEAPPRPSLNVESAALFAGISRCRLEEDEFELCPGLSLRATYAHVFAPPMVAVSPPIRKTAPHPPPWYALEGGGISEAIGVEVAMTADARPLGISRFTTLKLIASAIRLLSAQPVCMPLLSNKAFAEAKVQGSQAHMWRLEPPPMIFGQQVLLTRSFNQSLAGFLPNFSILETDADLSRAFTLADGMWWLPTLEAQLTTIWTAIEMLMRPGRRDTTKELARAVRSYSSLEKGAGDRLYQEVTRLYFARGASAHAGAEPSPKDVQDSYAILRAILIRALSERCRPPLPEAIVPLWQP